MKKTCAEVAKAMAYIYATTDKQHLDGTWVQKFQECVDFPKEPEKVEFDIVCGDTVGVIEIKDPGNKIKNQLKGKKWRVTATQVME